MFNTSMSLAIVITAEVKRLFRNKYNRFATKTLVERQGLA